ncbi:hypothetical protein BAN_0900011 [Borrelia anserina BA2]|uniref:Uncharacterized protein n=1 Tax=Borrelia anserina BA2 TaxID=1313293 RepID=W5SU85_BORAN|nr:hypothetical protein BAN_0900011 [Borrelia anserina BA2]
MQFKQSQINSILSNNPKNNPISRPTIDKIKKQKNN